MFKAEVASFNNLFISCLLCPPPCTTYVTLVMCPAGQSKNAHYRETEKLFKAEAEAEKRCTVQLLSH